MSVEWLEQQKKTLWLILLILLATNGYLLLKNSKPKKKKTELKVPAGKSNTSECKQIVNNKKKDVKMLLPRSAIVTDFERSLIQAGLENPALLDTRLITDIRYATANNFTYDTLYFDLKSCYVQAFVVDKLLLAQEYLHQQATGYRLVLLDCVRPLQVQYQMYKRVEGTTKERYVANPRGGSMHNYGVAVDVTLIDAIGNYVNMGCPFDYFGKLAQPRYNNYFLQQGQLSSEHIYHRNLLRQVMKQAGFIPINSEWWHFKACSNAYARQHFTVIP